METDDNKSNEGKVKVKVRKSFSELIIMRDIEVEVLSELLETSCYSSHVWTSIFSILIKELYKTVITTEITNICGT